MDGPRLVRRTSSTTSRVEVSRRRVGDDLSLAHFLNFTTYIHAQVKQAVMLMRAAWAGFAARLIG